MGRNTDKLYVTQSEHSGIDGRHGSSTGISHKKQAGSYRQLPYIYCSLTLQAWEHPVCIVDELRNATIFDLLTIVPWIQEKGTNPSTGKPLEAKSLLKLNFAKNDQDELCDPVTMKVFNDHTHIVAIEKTGNVFAYETIETLNYKAKHWKDLLTDEPFTRTDVITIQDPHNLSQKEVSILPAAREQTSASSNLKSVASSAPQSDSEKEKKVRAAREAIDRFRAGDAQPPDVAQALKQSKDQKKKALPYNAANYSTGYTAASFTSTGMAVKTADDRAILSEEQYLLHPKKIKIKGLGVILTNYGEMNIELWPEYAPKAVYNFIKLAKSGYYANVTFHRNIPGFMLQGGDPSGRGTGGKSIFGKEFEDEISPGRSHDKRGIISMANKGPATNSSQFFITYDSAKHLDKKHTIFGHLIGDLSTLDKIEHVPVVGDKPKTPIVMEEVRIVVDPFDEYLAKEKSKREAADKKHEVTEDDLQTWTNQPVGRAAAEVASASNADTSSIGKYLSAKSSVSSNTQRQVEIQGPIDRPTKKPKKSGFGDFSGW